MTVDGSCTLDTIQILCPHLLEILSLAPRHYILFEWSLGVLIGVPKSICNVVILEYADIPILATPNC